MFRTLLAAAFFLTVALSGCFGGDKEAPADSLEDDVADESPTYEPPAGMEVLAFDLDGPYSAKKWSNGTYAPQEGCTPANVVCSEAAQYADITDLFPPGIPVRLHAELTYNQGQANQLYLGLQTEKAYWSSFESRTETGQVAIETALTGWGGSVQLRVWAVGPRQDVPEAAYSLVASVTAESTWVPTGLPVEVELDAGDALDVRSPAGDPVPFDIFGPDDRFVAEGNGTWAVPGNGTAGAYLVRVMGEDGATIASGADATLRSVAFTEDRGEPQPVPTTGEASWDFSVPRQPVAVGFYHGAPRNPTDGGLWPSGSVDGYSVRVSGPGDFLLEAGPFCKPCADTASSEAHFEGGYKDPALMPGAYSLSVVEASGVVNREIGWWALYFER